MNPTPIKPLSEMNHYEVLEVSRDCRPEDVERAYQMVREAYAPGSLAAYSLFDESEASALRQRVESAYSILIDADRRHAYDDTLASKSLTPVDDGFGNAPAYDDDAGAEPQSEEQSEELAGFDDIDDGDPDSPWDGARLRRCRLARGIDLDAVVDATKVNPTYLHALETDTFSALPAPVYVRGFVDAYARFLGLDAREVASSYTTRYQQFLGHPPRPSQSHPASSRATSSSRTTLGGGEQRRSRF